MGLRSGPLTMRVDPYLGSVHEFGCVVERGMLRDTSDTCESSPKLIAKLPSNKF